MTTANYEFTGAVSSKAGEKSRAKYRKPVALVTGTVKGVPFRQVFKTWEAAERLLNDTFGAELFPL